MEAIILAGGRGTRLSSVVPDLPKPMAPVTGRPFLSWLLESLQAQGVTHVCLSTGYMAQAIESHYGTGFGGMSISYVRETSPLGTGGGIRAAMDSTQARNVLVLNGDSLSVTDLRLMMHGHVAVGERISMALCRVADTARYGAVSLQGGHVVGLSEKGVAGPGYINAGIYILQRDIFTGFGCPAVFSFETFLAEHLTDLRPAGFLSAGPFIDIGVPEDYARAQAVLPAMVRS